MIMPALLLQKPSYKSKSKFHNECLARRKIEWENGNFNTLLIEGRTIQKKITEYTRRTKHAENLPRRFAHLMLRGQTTAAMRLLDSTETSGILSLDDNVIEQLKIKHPNATNAEPSTLLQGEPTFVDPIMFNDLDECTIARAASRTKGAAGLSGMDAENWKRMILSKSFGKDSTSLQSSLAKMARILCTQELIDKPTSGNNILEAYTACRLIPLNKNPGVRPIGIGETIRRIIGKSILMIVRNEVVESAGSLQLCAGQPGGCEAAVHAANEIFQEEDTDCILLVDATNAFNFLNRDAMLHNIRYICAPLAKYIRNCYIAKSRLFIAGGGEISSSEGTTQGDPHAMPVYAVGITPLLPVHDNTSLDDHTKQIAFADDLLGAGKLRDVKNWWLQILARGPQLGYHPNPQKSWLVVKPENYNEAQKVFKGTSLNITMEGRKYLGGFIGSNEARDTYIHSLVDGWKTQLEKLCEVAKAEPQAAFNGFSSGFRHKLTYHMRVIPDLKDYLGQLDKILDYYFIPSITGGHICSDEERKLIALPMKCGGLSIPFMKELANDQHQDSLKACSQLKNNIVGQERLYLFDKEEHEKKRKEIVAKKIEKQKKQLKNVRSKLTEDENRANDLAQLKGASSWLSTTPSIHDNFSLNKREFQDAIALRYRWTPKYLPSICECGKPFTVDHALTCLKGGFIHQRHDELRDSLASVVSEVCTDVSIEPSLLELSGENFTKSSNKQDEARLDIAARGFWERGQRAFFDVRVFHPFARSHVSRDIQAVFKSNEKEKKRHYNKRVIEIEHGSFSPLVFSTLGGCGREAEIFLRRLAEKISKKKDLPFAKIIHWLRHKISVISMRSAILCLRGTRGKRYATMDSSNVLFGGIVLD